MKVPVRFTEFAERICKAQASRAQRVIAKVAIDGVEPQDLSADERVIFRRHFGDLDTIPPEARATLAFIFGARSGKSYYFGGLYLLWRAVTADLATLAPGEVAVGLAVAPDLRLARQIIRYALGAAKSVPSIAVLIESETADGFTLRRPDGYLVSIEALPATRGGSAVRGRSLIAAVLDEASFFRDESSIVNDVEVYKGVAPRVLPGGLVVIITTAWAELGLAYDLFQANFGHPVTALAAHATTEQMRDDDPRILAMVARERLRDPENAKHEFDAEFRTSGSTIVFPSEFTAPCFSHELPESDQIEYYAPIGVLDMSSGGDDATTAAIVRVIRVPEMYDDSGPGALFHGRKPAVDEHGNYLGHMIPTVSKQFWNAETKTWDVREIEPTHPQKAYLAFTEIHVQEGGFWGTISGEDLMRPICSMFRRWGVRRVFADKFERGLANNELRKAGLLFHDLSWTSETKHEAVTLLKREMSDKKLIICECERMRKELVSYQQKAQPGGAFKYAARGKRHDDVISLLINAAMAMIQGHLQGSELFNRGGRFEAPGR